MNTTGSLLVLGSIAAFVACLRRVYIQRRRRQQRYEMEVIKESLFKRMDVEGEALIAEIEGAFDGVERGSGVSIHEAREIDYHGSREKLLAARARDNERSWREVPPESLTRNDQYLSFLDAEGLRYYLPALMIWYLKSDGRLVSGDELLFALSTTDAERDFCLLDHRQSSAVLAFLRYLPRIDSELQEEVQNAHDRYWGKFARG